ncbi:MAG: phosphoribosylformylglycinamidine cyclo-ligase [Candidatus Moranbacteria bacterium RIFOXYA1_FULL_44_7]|nr:MAG: phosphoribosylformylglycinamidine cyclo-ligase [Candidatus Moranbacteria bacterium RIFOXYA1_FULL_44_7]
MAEERKGMTYKDAGVDIDAANRAVALMKERIQRTYQNFTGGEILTKIGGFNGLARLMPDGRVISMSTDGVGTKIKLAILLNQHDTVGVDLVGMCVNDILVSGVSPAFFLDYLAMGKLIPEQVNKIVGGVADGCDLAEMALMGGETAEMPGMYKPGDYDMAGFAVGFAGSQVDIIDGSRIRPCMNVYGAASSGIHSNGFSLIRPIFGISDNNPEKSRQNLNRYYKQLGCTLGEELLKPTEIYTKLVKTLKQRYEIFGMVHITGGGFVDNPPRILPPGCSMRIRTKSWKRPPIFQIIRKRGGVSGEEMLRTFNCGIALLVISPDKIFELEKIGTIVPGNGEVIFV